MEQLARPAELSARYRVWLCDVWGVLHDGRSVFRDAADALCRHRQSGGCVVLVTNAPRPSRVILPQLKRFQVPDEAYDGVVSSGDTTRDLVARRAGSKMHHVGPQEDISLLEGLPVTFTGLEAAQSVLITGLLRDGRDGGESEAPEDYVAMLEAMLARGLDLICANPDKVVGVGDRLYPCAGAVAEIYERMGGTVEMAGKPFAPIYEVALRLAGPALGRDIDRAEVLCIGDGLPTDIEGARRNGFAAYFVTHGIHAADFDGDSPDGHAAALVRQMPGLRLAGLARALRW